MSQNINCDNEIVRSNIVSSEQQPSRIPERYEVRWPVWVRYLVTILIEVVLTGTLLLLHPIFPLGSFPITYVLTIGIVAYLFGERSAILAFVIGLLAFQYFFVPPGGRLWPIADTPQGWSSWIAFVLGNVLVGLAMSRIRSLQHRTHEALWMSENELAGRMQAEDALRHLLDEVQRDRKRLEAMEGIADASISTTELGEVLNVIAERVAHALGTHSCTIFLLEGLDELVARAAYGIPEECGFRIRKDQCLAGKIISTLKTVYVANAECDSIITDLHIKRVGVKSLLGTPLIARGNVVGVMYVDALEERDFGWEESRLLEAMASRTALIIENSRLYEQLVQSRDEIQTNFTHLQRTLLPPAELDAGTDYRMAAAYLSPYGLEIGGDFYDVFETEAGNHAILIGDVAGKGIPAVSLATATRSTIRALVYDIPSVGAAVTHANSVLCPQVFEEDDSTFVSAFVADIDPSTGSLNYVCAGHPPPAIYRDADGTVEFLKARNPLLRIAPHLVFEESTSCLSPGDKMVLYTDGLSEARHGSALLGFEGIQKLLEEHGRLAPNELVAQLIDAASDWTGGNLTDDTAILVIERLEV